MAYRILVPIFLLVYLGLGIQKMAHANLNQEERSRITHLLELINQRFQLQKDVAAYKHNANMPSFIPGREQQILADVRNTSNANHLELQSVQNFIDIQMRASVDVQLKWRSHWKRTEFPQDYPIRELNGYIRPELSRITKEMVQEIGKNIQIINNPENFEEISSLFSEVVDDPFITGSHRDAILHALVRIRRV